MILRRLLLAVLLLALAGAALAAVLVPAPSPRRAAELDPWLEWCRADRVPMAAPDVCAFFRAPR